MNSPALFRRRSFLLASGVAALIGVPGIGRLARAEDVVDITMAGTPNGSSVWFKPRGLLIQPGQSVRWINRDSGNSHTSTAYHPANFGKALRIPRAAKSWDSGFLLPGESYTLRFDVPGVYDYFCLPHEHAGMVARLIVGEPDADAQALRQASDGALPPQALAGFPTIEQVLAKRVVD
ncbi:plastocyanin/azurin family copper-binding protein [Castellaniella sp. GW247-6E4]|uniref:plastocyanin/azurin family copper-binding protein n=1 Tax=Castellaniella sp. GW247-6E4 TaxID=3140380 RepID=UPI003315137D